VTTNPCAEQPAQASSDLRRGEPELRPRATGAARRPPEQPVQASRKPWRGLLRLRGRSAVVGRLAKAPRSRCSAPTPNPTAVLRAGPQFPSSGGRSGASGRPPNPATALAAGAAVGLTADEAVDGGVRSSFRQSFRLGRSAPWAPSSGTGAPERPSGAPPHWARAHRGRLGHRTRTPASRSWCKRCSAGTWSWSWKAWAQRRRQGLAAAAKRGGRRGAHLTTTSPFPPALSPLSSLLPPPPPPLPPSPPPPSPSRISTPSPHGLAQEVVPCTGPPRFPSSYPLFVPIFNKPDCYPFLSIQQYLSYYQYIAN
jgi:hypothetical protein